MSTYVVRMKRGEKYNGPRLVGVWVAENDGELWWRADQVGDPGTMECAALSFGGMMLCPPDYTPELDEGARLSKWQPLRAP